MYSNILYFDNINSIGGVEQFFYYIAKKYNDYDITIVYSNGDAKQIARLREYVRVIKFDGKRIKCKKAFFNYSKQIIDKVDAEEYIEVIHFVPTEYQLVDIHPKITRYLGVSKLVCKEFTRLQGKPCELAYNPVDIDKPRKVLKLISATRLTLEKGKKRMIKLGEELDKAGIPYIWLVFTNDKDAIDNPNIIYREPTLKIVDYIAMADYLVQLSDTESFSISINEALKLGVPIISTDLPILKELGIENGKQGYLIDKEMTNIPIDDIYNKIPKVKYNPPKDNWENILAKGKSTYKKECSQKYKVKFLNDVYYKPHNKKYERNKEYIIDKKAINELLDYKVIELR